MLAAKDFRIEAAIAPVAFSGGSGPEAIYSFAGLENFSSYSTHREVVMQRINKNSVRRRNTERASRDNINPGYPKFQMHVRILCTTRSDSFYITLSMYSTIL